jgi:hypothetical protein
VSLQACAPLIYIHTSHEIGSMGENGNMYVEHWAPNIIIIHD